MHRASGKVRRTEAARPQVLNAALPDDPFAAALGVHYECLDAMPAGWKRPCDMPCIVNLSPRTQRQVCADAFKGGRVERRLVKLPGWDKPQYVYKPI